MKKNKEKKNRVRKKIMIGSIGFIFLVLIITTFFGKKGLFEVYRAKKRQNDLVEEIEKMREREKVLKEEIELLEKDPKAVEKKAREKLWMMKSDEIVIVDDKK
ncbi:MAG: septum formation initiator family protein [Candidatus Aminicenantes bacterium]|nr:septum formation initiator family protein [Candidatus Aminicenantes bacterium]